MLPDCSILKFFIFSSEIDISFVVQQYLPKSCGGCQSTETLDLWPHSAKNPILLSVGHLRKTTIPVLVCTSCGTANYPDMTSFGIFPLHNKCLISIDYILELKDILASGILYFKLWIIHDQIELQEPRSQTASRTKLLSLV